MQIPALSKSFQSILEFGGLNQSDFMGLVQAPVSNQVAPQGQPVPQIQLNQPVEA
jgi:hypothetical protein